MSLLIDRILSSPGLCIFGNAYKRGYWKFDWNRWGIWFSFMMFLHDLMVSFAFVFHEFNVADGFLTMTNLSLCSNVSTRLMLSSLSIYSYNYDLVSLVGSHENDVIFFFFYAMISKPLHDFCCAYVCEHFWNQNQLILSRPHYELHLLLHRMYKMLSGCFNFSH